jgi:UDP-N-acetylmuramoylalanine--D-glutamate ligase
MAKRIAILGAGESGVGTAILAKQKDYEVFVSDFGKITETYKDVLEHFEIEWEENQHTASKILNADVVMKSPGIPDKAPIIKQLKDNKVAIVSEIEFASEFTNATIIGITGSNGKTTVTRWTHHILKEGGLNASVGGNIGDSFAKQVAVNPSEHYVLELSSFQLDDIKNFRPHIAIITNITPDHLDRYDYDFSKYVASKFRITMNQTKDDYLIYDADNEAINDYLEAHTIQPKLVPFSTTKPLKYGAYIEHNELIINIDENKIHMPIDSLALKGTHNQKNAMASSSAAKMLKIRKQTIRESLANFQGVEHRLEHVLKINNVNYINDSKATNVNATFYALESMSSDTIWIVGGVDKGNDYSQLNALVNEKVKAIICLGVDNQKILKAFNNCVDIMVETQSMSEAIKIAYKIGERGDAVLLSPACASFDLFKNYEDRGRQFKEAVRLL